MIRAGRVGKDLLFLQKFQGLKRCCVEILKCKHLSHCFLYFTLYAYGRLEVQLAMHGTHKLSFPLVVFQQRGHHINSLAVCVLLWEEKKLQTGSFSVLRGSLQRNICFQASSEMTEAG